MTADRNEKDRTVRPHRIAVVALLFIAVVGTEPLFHRLDHYGRVDWDQFTFRYETPRIAMLRDHQLPFWNPYTNGGNVLLAHPDCPAGSPWYLIVLLFGANIGLRIQVTFFCALGMIGMAWLLASQRVGLFGQLAGGFLFMFNNHFLLHITEGHLEWCVLGLMPWMMLLLKEKDRKSGLWAVALLASVLTFGAVYIPAVYLPFFSFFAAFLSIKDRSARPLVRWALVVVGAVGLSAFKLLPVVSFAQDNHAPVTVKAFHRSISERCCSIQIRHGSIRRFAMVSRPSSCVNTWRYRLPKQIR